jgi:hypothetical protein
MGYAENEKLNSVSFDPYGTNNFSVPYTFPQNGRLK